jgi:hypothetical protein
MAPRKLAPIHPGEVLGSTFWRPLGFRSTVWPRTSVYPRAGSTRSCTGHAPSPRTPPSASPAISAPVTGSGSIFRRGMISKWSATTSAPSWNAKFASSIARANSDRQTVPHQGTRGSAVGQAGRDNADHGAAEDEPRGIDASADEKQRTCQGESDGQWIHQRRARELPRDRAHQAE